MKDGMQKKNNRRSVLTVSLVFTTLLLLTPLIYSPVAAVALPPPPSGWNFRAAGGWDRIVDLSPLAHDYVSYVKNKTGFTLPDVPSGTHVWVYTVYINSSNSQTFYAGIMNFTSSTTNYTMPEQLLIHHFTTRGGDDAIFAASFSLLMASNTTDNAIYGSFTLGKESLLTQLRAYDPSIPSLVGKTSIIPLTHSSDNNTWNWGMKYQNLTTIWWRMFFANSSYQASPFAVMVFSELSFNYGLTITPSTLSNPAGNITTRVDYIIGNVSAAWDVERYPNGTIYDVSSEPVHSFLSTMKLSILQHEKTSVYGKQLSTDSNNANAHNASLDVSASSINGKAGGDLIYSTDFARKRNYTLYAPAPSTYATTTATYPFKGIVDNSIFNDTNRVYALLHRIVSFVPQFFDTKGRSFETTMADADTVYVISYPHWSGYRIVHDPYFAVFTGNAGGAGVGTSGLLIILVVAAALVVTTAFVVIRVRTGKRGS
jgi:hypothetical protein